MLDRLLEAVRAGDGRALVVRGEPGVGKTALLEYLVAQASECTVARATGVQAEMELAFAGLHQLCAPMLDRLERLPGPQRDALGTAFGLQGGDAPDRFLVGLAVLSLCSEVAAERPLVCVVDDAHWLDGASRQALGFVARRLATESVGLVFAVRESGEELAGLAELVVEGLGDRDALALLASVMQAPLDEQVRERIIAEARGNPLALMELPHELTPAQLAGGFGLPHAPALWGRIEDSFRRRLEPLPSQTRRLLEIAAAEPTGDSPLVWRAAERLGIGAEAAQAAEAAGLVEFGATVRFRHPLVRSAIYHAASRQDRQTVHRALADATDPRVDPDRRAWQRAQAAAGLDEDVAYELERSAVRAQARGGRAAAAAFLQRASELTPDPARGAQRALAAAQAKHQAGAPEAALQLLADAQAGPLDELQRARADMLRAQIAFATSFGRDAPHLLLQAARRLEPLDVGQARETYLQALYAAMFAGRLGDDGGVLGVAEAARAAPAPAQPPRPVDLLLDGMAALVTEGHGAGAPTLKRALRAFGGGHVSTEEQIRWLNVACRVAIDLWDDETWHLLATRQVELARSAGALSELPIALNTLIGAQVMAGELEAAATLIEEAQAATEATGSRHVPYGAIALAAWQGREAEASQLYQATLTELESRGEGIGVTAIEWARAQLYNSLGRYEDALGAAQQAGEHPEDGFFSTWSLVELIEAAAPSREPDRAADALARLAQTTQASGGDWALGIEARSRALLSEGEAAERLYGEAIERLSRTRVRGALARAHLVYGEWLRRQKRRLDAREQLRTAHEMLAAMGAEGFAARAARELLATGETARKRTVEDSGRELTAQEARIARLARDGLSNADIGTRLFISPRTVEYHLSKVFAKLDINSRTQLEHALPNRHAAAQPA